MRLALIIIAVFIISASGLAVQTVVSEDVESLFRTDLRECFINDPRNTQQTARESRSITGKGKGYLFNERIYKTQPEESILAFNRGRTKRLEHGSNILTELEVIADRTMFARAEIPADVNRIAGEVAKIQVPNKNYFVQIISRIRNVYDSWAAKDDYGSIRLVLLCFGMVGLIGIRRKFKRR